MSSIGRPMIRLGVQHGSEFVGHRICLPMTYPRHGPVAGRVKPQTHHCWTSSSNKPTDFVMRFFNSSSAALAPSKGKSKNKGKGKPTSQSMNKSANARSRQPPKRRPHKISKSIERAQKQAPKETPPAYLTRTASPYVYIARSAIMNDMTGEVYVDPLTLYSELYASNTRGDSPANKSSTKRRNVIPHIFRQSHLQYFSPASFPNHEPPTDGTPEVAFLGRSNTGKSSLINALHSLILRSGGGVKHTGSGGGELARTSKTPGRTQTINYFGLVHNGPATASPKAKLFLVDLPGFGYASAPDESVDEWQKRTQQFLISRTLPPLEERGGIQPWQSVAKPQNSKACTGNHAIEPDATSPPLKRLYLLLDSRLPEPTLLDLTVMGWCDDYSIPYTLVLTKVDGTSRAHCVKLTNQLCMRYHSLLLDNMFSEDESEDDHTVYMDPVVYWTSAKDGLGMEELLLGVEGNLFEAEGDDDESDMLGGELDESDAEEQDKQSETQIH
ncbi:hypothetical protein HJC23_013892 [Cyclotella cryptica]|uniref:EngB-type G domain-containing protein n=1 Tax=Cyclotella cryptica TaxID=29204 RepID=A0ABD3QGD6_9STRA